MRFDVDDPDVLARIADAAEKLDGCEPGVEWGRTHRWQDVATSMDATHAAWVLFNFAPDMSLRLIEEFVRAVRRAPATALRVWHYVQLTERQAADLEAAILAAGVRKWRTAEDRPGAKAR